MREYGIEEKPNFYGTHPRFDFWFYHLQDIGAVYVIRVEFCDII